MTTPLDVLKEALGDWKTASIAATTLALHCLNHDLDIQAVDGQLEFFDVEDEEDSEPECKPESECMITMDCRIEHMEMIIDEQAKVIELLKSKVGL